jgi:hypothetical protein
MTDYDNNAAVPIKELTRLRRVEAAARALRSEHNWRKNSEAEELLLIALDIALLTGEEFPASA